MSAENDALVGALLWLNDEPSDNRLMEASFGRYADGSGCWWNLRFAREVTSGEVQDSRQDDEKRFLTVVEAWARDLAKAAPKGPEE